jgi:membrane protein implicated in regulation of membrane protease activity
MVLIIGTCMGKNRDLAKVLLLILLGMFIPFLGSIALSYGLVFEKIVVTFLYFLIIFGCELAVVYVYFTLSGRRANQKMEQYKPK